MKLKRRDFMKVISVAGVGAGLLPKDYLFSSPTLSVPNGMKGKWMSTVCQGCTTWCPAQAYVINGRVIKVRGNPHSKANHGKVCPKAHLAIQQMYDPDRIKVPLKRTNPKKGRNEDPKFIPISWDEAINTIADKMLELRKREVPERFAVLRGRYSYMRDCLYGAVPKILGSPNGISHSAICAEAEKFASFYTEGYWDYNDYDLEHTKYVLSWGADPLSSNRMIPHAISIWGKVRDQAKIAVVDPRLSSTAAKADHWLPIVPGQDGALALAIAYTILTEGLWSKEFVGVFKDGKNLFVKDREIDETQFEEKHTHGVIKWWNLDLKNKTPEWAEKKCGISADLIKKIAIDFALAAPRAISWVSPGASMQVRGGYGAMAAHALNGLVGSIDNKGGVVQKKSPPVNKTPKYSKYQDELAKKHSKLKKIDQRGSKAFPAMKKKPGKGVVTNNVADAILENKPYPLEMAIGYWNNFAYSCSGAERWERALTKLPFFVHITTNAAEMTQFADIVLPAAFHMFEKWSFVKQKQNLHGYAGITQKIVEPFWDVKMDETEIPYMIAKKLADKGFSNLLDYYKNEFKDPETNKVPETEKEFALSALKFYTHPLWNGSAASKGDKITSWKEFRKLGVWNTKRYTYKAKWDHFKTETKKFEFYSETLKKNLNLHAEKHSTTVDDILKTCKYTSEGELAFIPHYEEPYRWGNEKEFPLIFSEHRSRLNREGRSQNTSWYYAHKNCDPGDENWDDVVKLHPKTAKAHNLKNGDKVRVTSPTGSLECTLKEWEGIRPGVAIKCFGQGHWAYGSLASANYNKKIPRGGSNNHILPADYERLSGSTARHGGVTRVKIEKIV